MEEGYKKITIDEVISCLKNANLSLSEYNNLRKRYTRVFDFDDDEFAELKSKITSAFTNYLKYIILSHQYMEFNGKLEGYIYEENSLQYLVKNKIIKDFVIDELDKFDEKDYPFYYKFIELVYEKDYENIEKCILNNINIKLSIKKYENIDIPNYLKFFLITNNFSKKRLEDLLNEEEKDKYMTLEMEVISETNDKFSSVSSVQRKPNKIDEKNLDDFYKLVDGIKVYSYFLYTNRNSFNFNLEDKYYLFNINNYSTIINKSKEDINELLKYYKDTYMISYALKNELSISDIITYSSLDLKNDLLIFLFVNSVSIENYNYLKDSGFNDELVKKIVNINGNDYTKYNNVKEKYFELLPYLSYETINNLNDDYGEYLLNKKNEISKLFQNKNYEEYYFGFVKILQKEEVKDYLDLIKNTDFEQLKIYDNLSRYTRHENSLTSDDMVNNVLANIDGFEGNINILHKIPIMLDNNNNQIILDALVEYGLNKDDMEYLDGTIFCYPNEIVLNVFKILKQKEVDVIINNKLNANVIKYVTQMIQKQMNYEFPAPIIYRPEKRLNKVDAF